MRIVHDMGMSGNLHSQQDEETRRIYTQLLSRQWQGKALWEGIRDEELTAAPCLVGNRYWAEPTKIMIVGRAVNGWEVPFQDCSTLDRTVKSILHQENRLDDFAREFIIEGEGENQHKYYYAKSPFLRMMRLLVSEFSGTEENWQQRIAWSNLFQVAPRKTGNPAWRMVRDDLPLYIRILRREIWQYEPNLVLFATDMNFFDHYSGNAKYASFCELLNPQDVCSRETQYVRMAGTFVDDPDIKMIVCCRPEGKPADKLIKEIRKVYTELKESV